MKKCMRGIVNWRKNDDTRKIVFWLFIALWIAFTLVSLKFRILDAFFPGTAHGNIGNDFFSVPLAFQNLLQGKSIYGKTLIYKGIQCSAYYYHPFLSIALSPWLNWLPPWKAYGVFVILSIAMLLYCSFLIRKISRYRLLSDLAVFCIVCGFPCYLMLWNAQMHIFTVLSISLLMYGVVRRDVPANAHGINPYVMAGLLVSLLSKPVIVMILPVLLIYDRTRKTALTATGLYLLLSLLFLIIPFFNPEGFGGEQRAVLLKTVLSFLAERDMAVFRNPEVTTILKNGNYIHWLNIINQSINQSNVMYCHDELFSLANLITLFNHTICNVNAIKLFPLLPAAMSFSLLFIKEDTARNTVAVLLMMTIVYSYYLSYTNVWEYHYTTLLPLVPLHFILASEEPLQGPKRILLFCGYLSCAIPLPSLYVLFRPQWQYRIPLSVASRVIPVLISYLFLMITVIMKLVPIFSGKVSYGSLRK